MTAGGRLRVRPLFAAACGAIVLAAAGYGGWGLLANRLPDSVPRCSWPLKPTGPASAEQARLVRCYVKAVAQRDLTALRSLAVPGPGLTIGSSALAHSADAMSGTAAAAFVPNPSDSADVTVTLAYADGNRQSFEIELANPASSHSWRIAMGTYRAGTPGTRRTPPAPAEP